MRTLSQMGLTTWDQADDNYDYQQLANNWNLVNFHDHTPSRGVPIPAGGLAPGAVLSQNIAAAVIGPQHLSTALQNTAWVTPTISSPWTAGGNHPQYMKSLDGFVHLRGNMTASSAETNATAFTLPVGYRPGISDYYPVLATSGASGSDVYITTAGLVQGSQTAGSALYLSGISFLAEN